ncbi:MAG: chemotaxis protein CheD [Peptostreptococcaceae bacterium]|nr:chemotaxis protein CheD [Peptostreptococcaceae bacterium]
MSKQYIVGIADMKQARATGNIITYALGSCIGICLYDPMIKLGAMVHIMLPEAPKTDIDNLFKYADTGIRETIRKMEAFGAVRARMVAKIAGGAKMFDIPDSSALGNIGERNASAVKRILMTERIRLLKEDLGANYARTMVFDVETGMAKIKVFGREEINF